MRVRLIAVGTRMSAWVQAACEDYCRRMRSSLPLTVCELPVARRAGPGDAPRAMAAEADRLLATLAPREFVVALDERGAEMSSAELARWLAQRRQSGQDLALLIGGPDGFDPKVLARAQQRWSLSKLTLPHALARVLVIEQLYRAASLLAGHPYHRGSRPDSRAGDSVAS